MGWLASLPKRSARRPAIPSRDADICPDFVTANALMNLHRFKFRDGKIAR
jgi:hypothetical protein